MERASALSAKDIWAIGGALSPDTTIFRYNGATWAPVTARALAHSQFISILAISDSNVWASADNGGLKTWLVHRHGTRWFRMKVPFGLNAGAITADGHGGIYVSAQGSGKDWELHLSRSGHWTRIQTPPAAVVHIPGTTALWGAGAKPLTPTGSDAVIWAHGRV